ncbi:PREDICTED: uncharacterized protein LOC105361888 isoform X2 [Ceratosolen solmsi marchali]|uniref:Uncharacterized protein LOC105361888 isoform X2 n=1 Tax=Ceratosolen solmsi marchali TaxID=326594 RepID=A0AAJ6YG83_9HYME|nr:PREDICTED: uncharacterized protein LOC105361888 isoform X2 [Ceratosolen solmsi marchali]
MERLSTFAYRIGWPWRTVKALEEKARRRQKELEEKERRQRQYQCSFSDVSKRLIDVIESVLLWENAYNSISVAMAFNILFWGFVVLEVRGFAAASSAALVIVLCYSTLETQEEVPNLQIWQSRNEQLEKLVKKVKLTFENLLHMQQEQPKVFCIIICTISLGLWLIGRNLDSILFTYTLCMGILLGPAFLLRLLCKELSYKEWDNEMEEFLPAVTEDSLQVLKRAGETGDRSPTPPNQDMNISHQFNDEDLFDLKIPSHDDGSTDGLELSELELSNSETDIDGIRFQTGYFERDSSSSDDDVDLGLGSKKFNEDDYDSENSEFEIIDSRDVANLKSV